METENTDFFEKVYAVVAQIPYGKVTSYGLIAQYLGAGRSARVVGWAMNNAHGTGLPCHRVVNRFGGLSGKHRFETPTLMEDLLRSEGVEFDENGCVVMEKHEWNPQESIWE